MSDADDGLDLRSASRAALVAALGLTLPAVFHWVRLGHVFLPMYLPLLVGGFILPPGWAAIAGVATPLVSALVLGMPPLLPPIAPWMAVELGAMCALGSLLHRRWRWPTLLALPVVLLAGRAVFALLAWGTATALSLPPRLLTLASLLAGWPGMVLAMLVVPSVVLLVERGARGTAQGEAR